MALNKRPLRDVPQQDIDQYFAKPPQSDAKTLWHFFRLDRPVTGTMVPSLRIPLTPIFKANCPEVLAGTQHDDVPYWRFSPNARKMIKPDDRVPRPEIESKRGDSRPDHVDQRSRKGAGMGRCLCPGWRG